MTSTLVNIQWVGITNEWMYSQRSVFPRFFCQIDVDGRFDFLVDLMLVLVLRPRRQQHVRLVRRGHHGLARVASACGLSEKNWISASNKFNSTNVLVETHYVFTKSKSMLLKNIQNEVQQFEFNCSFIFYWQVIF